MPRAACGAGCHQQTDEKPDLVVDRVVGRKLNP